MGTIATGKLAPSFSLPGTDGNHYSLNEALTRGPLLVAFFKAGCPTCQYAFPFIERIYQQFRPNGIQIWAISQENTRDSQSCAKTYGVTFPVLIDDYPYEVARAYGIEYVPTLFLIKPDRHVELTTDGFAKADFLAVQKWFGRRFSANPPALFLPSERVPEFKPG